MEVHLEMGENSLRLAKGETIIGRGLSCHFRFNDPTISREHARITLRDGRLEIEDLGTTNGTRVNGVVIPRATQLHDGDVIQVSFRTIRVRVIDDAEQVSDAEPTISRIDSWPGETTPVGGSANTGKDEWERDKVTPARSVLDVSREAVVRPQHQLCRRCQAPVPLGERVCTKCGSPLQPMRATMVTQRISIKELKNADNRRRDPRRAVEFPVLYSSDSLSFEAAARDLSKGGIFLASEVLDHEGTPCLVTLLPDGAPPLPAEGVVCHVVAAEAGSGGRPPGMGIRFTKMASETRQWIEQAARP